MIKIIHISESDYEGGAAKAAFRILDSLNKDQDLECVMRVNKKFTNNKKIFSSNKLNLFLKHLKCYLSVKIQKMQKTNNSILHSLSLFPSFLDIELNKSSADIIHLHWVQGEMISIEEIGNLKKPIIWTLHDSWPYCGSEHHPNGIKDIRFIKGYDSSTRDPSDKGIDLDKFNWNRKVRSWKNQMVLVAPSSWIASCAKKSKLMSNQKIKVIPNPLPIDIYKPRSKNLSRKKFSLPLDKKLILYGSLSSFEDEMKGWNLFKETVQKISKKSLDVSIVIFGCKIPSIKPKLNLPLYFVGRITDEKSLSYLYSAVDLIATTSKIESFGQTVSEAHSCGTPAVAFNTTGLKDVIDHKITGYLAKPFCVESFVRGIYWILNNEERYLNLSINSRKRAIRFWSNKVISKQYKNLYLEMLNEC